MTMTKYYVSDTWDDTTPHYFNYNTKYTVWYNYCSVQLNKPATDHKRAFEDARTGYCFIHGWYWVSGVVLNGDEIYIDAYIGGYHGYDKTRANISLVIGDEDVFDVKPRPDLPWVRLNWNMNSFGWSNGSYNHHVYGTLKLTDPPQLDFYPKNPGCSYNRITELEGKTVNVLFGYVDAWSADWNQWASAHKNSYIDLPTAVAHTKELQDVAKTIDSEEHWRGFYRTISDAAMVSEISFKKLVSRTLSESAKAYDFKGFVIKPMDIFRGTDFEEHWRNFYRTISDAAAVADMLQKRWGRIMVLRDRFIDEGSIGFGFGRRLEDSLAVYEVKLIKIPSKAFLEPVKGLDLLGKSVTSHVSEVFIASDFLGKDVHKPFMDSLKAYDFKGFVISPSDLLKAADFEEHWKTLYKSVEDAVKALDFVLKSSGFRRSFSDSARAADLLEKGISLIHSDVWAVSDVLSRDLGKVSTDSLAASDWIARLVGRVLADSAVATDFVERQRGALIILRDTLVDEGYMSKGIVWHFREWWVFVKDYGPFREIGKLARDHVKAYDFKGFVIQPKEFVSPTDWLLKGVGKGLLEPVKGIDWISKSLLSHIADAWRVEERVERFYRGTLEISDVASSVDFFSKGVSTTLRDAFKGYDFKGFVPLLKDAVKAVEVKVLVGKGLTMILVDRFVDEGYVAKLPARTVGDLMKSSDFLLKVAFTLFGEAARRVYFHKVHGDIILPEDHNVRNLAAQALVEAVKRLKDKLEQM